MRCLASKTANDNSEEEKQDSLYCHITKQAVIMQCLVSLLGNAENFWEKHT